MKKIKEQLEKTSAEQLRMTHQLLGKSIEDSMEEFLKQQYVVKINKECERSIVLKCEVYEYKKEFYRVNIEYINLNSGKEIMEYINYEIKRASKIYTNDEDKLQTIYKQFMGQTIPFLFDLFSDATPENKKSFGKKLNLLKEIVVQKKKTLTKLIEIETI